MMRMSVKESLKHTSDPLFGLNNEDGYLLITVAMIGVVMAILFTYILPQMHTGQQIRAITNLNEYRAQEAARKGIHAVKAGMEQVNNLQDLLGYSISGATPATKSFAMPGNYAALFGSGVSLVVVHSAGNNGTYTITGATNYNVSGVTTHIDVLESFTSGTTQGLIHRKRGILWAVEEICGSATAPKHDEYRDYSGETRFVSNCLGINLGPIDRSGLDILVLVSRNGVLNGMTVTDGNPRNDGVYFFHSGVTADVPDRTPWYSADNWSGVTPVGNFEYVSGSSIYYYDFDMAGTLTGSDYESQADVKVDRSTGTWKISVGNDGSWRKTYSGTELWNLQKNFLSGDTPFEGRDNDADGANDTVEVFVIVRSKGVVASPGPNYAADKKSLVLVRDAPGSHLPSPPPGVLEGGFYERSGVTSVPTTQDFYSHTADGWIAKENQATWDAAHDAASGDLNPGGVVTYGEAEASRLAGQYSIDRFFASFDTSGLPDDAQTVSAQVWLYTPQWADDANNNKTYHVVASTQQSATSLIGDDFDQVGDVSFGSWDIGSLGWQSISLNQDGLNAISRTAYTRLAVRQENDLNNESGGIQGENWVRISTAESGNAPYLRISYGTPTTGPVCFQLSQVNNLTD